MNPALDLLSRDEIRSIIGSPTRRIQIKWLEEREWPHEVSYLGFPIVLRSVALERLGALPEAEPWNLDEADVA